MKKVRVKQKFRSKKNKIKKEKKEKCVFVSEKMLFLDTEKKKKILKKIQLLRLCKELFFCVVFHLL